MLTSLKRHETDLACPGNVWIGAPMSKLFADAALLAALFAPPALAQSDMTQADLAALPDWDVVLVAHRGLAPGLPENTLAAFQDVVSRGVRVIEVDLRGTADGEVVVMHDETVDRTTDGVGDVTTLTLAEVKALDAGSYAGAEFAGERVPTYEEALAFAQDNGVILLLDIKVSDALDVRRIVGITEAQDAVLNVIVGARTLEDLDEFRSYNPNLRTLGFISDATEVDAFAQAGIHAIRLWPQWIRGEDSERGPIPADCAGVENCLVRRVQAHGLPVWTTAGEAGREELTQLIAAGVNGILTDVPDVLDDLLDDIEAAQGEG
jgi:glycerophosphoryl diester phosphodiesterase